jgi:hypothetical protein
MQQHAREESSVRRLVGLTCSVALGAGLLISPLGAQSPASTEAHRFIVIGCVKPFPGQAPGKETDATIADYRGGPSTFQLDASDPLVAPWVNDTVELTGTLVAGAASPAAKAPAAAGAKPAAPGAGAKPTPAGPEPVVKLKAEKVLEIARGCTTIEGSVPPPESSK